MIILLIKLKKLSIHLPKYPFITLVNKKSDAIHLPGSKVIQAFHEGLKHIDDQYDIIVKADADLIFPNNYFETIIKHFPIRCNGWNGWRFLLC